MKLEGTYQLLFIVSQLLFVVSLIGFIWLVVNAFRTRIWWGFAVFFLSPIAATIYGIKFWRDAKKPFLLFITTFVASVGIGMYAFSAAGGMKVVKSAFRVHQGIQNQNLTEEETMEFMRNNLDFMEKAGGASSEEDRQKMELMRKFLKKAEGGLTEEEQQQIRQEFQNLGRQSGQSQGQQQQVRTIEQPSSRTAPPRAKNTPRQQVVARQTRSRSIPAVNPEGPGFRMISPYEAKDYIGASVVLIGRDERTRKGTLIGVSGNRLRIERRFGASRVSYEVRASDIKSVKVLLD